MEAMDTTYLAHILWTGSLLADDEIKQRVKAVKDVRNKLCHDITESMDEGSFNETCDQLLDAFEEIVKPTFATSRQRHQFMSNLHAFADPAAIDSITEEELRQYRDEIADLKRRLEEAEKAGNVQEVEYENVYMRNHTIAPAQLRGANITPEQIRAAGNAIRGHTTHATHRNAVIENSIVGAVVIEVCL